MKNIFRPGDILLPEGVCLTKWSVVACDQYTSEPEYWGRVERLVGSEPSTLNMIVPEAALALDAGFAIAGANAAMEKYLCDGVFTEHRDCMIYVERTLRSGGVRKGLVGALDLEAYDYHPGAASPVRATERTVAERLPIRVKVREHAPLELPHAMVLTDDPAGTVIEPLGAVADTKTPLYDFELMEQSGRLRGWEVTGDALGAALAALEALASEAEKKGLPAIAVGDGNHSLAAAKLCWESIKKQLPRESWESHPARFALAELVNLHDPALSFEPIHRVLFDVEPEKLEAELTAAGIDRNDVGALQIFLDGYVDANGGRMDYIHGEEAARRLGAQPGCMALLLPPMDKSALIPMVARDGCLPRKAFSMGNAEDKRFYLEARRITP